MSRERRVYLHVCSLKGEILAWANGNDPVERRTLYIGEKGELLK